MGQRPVGVTDTASGAGVADFRTRERSVGGATVCEQYLIPVEERVPSYRGAAADWWSGNASPETAKCVLSNLAGSGVLVAVESVLVDVSVYSTANTAFSQVRLYKQANTATGGASVLAKESIGLGNDAAQSSNASVELISRHAGDTGVSPTAITITLGGICAAMPAGRMRTTLGQAAQDSRDTATQESFELIPDLPIILRAGESLAVTSLGGTTNRFMLCPSWIWAEYTLP